MLRTTSPYPIPRSTFFTQTPEERSRQSREFIARNQPPPTQTRYKVPGLGTGGGIPGAVPYLGQVPPQEFPPDYLPGAFAEEHPLLTGAAVGVAEFSESVLRSLSLGTLPDIEGVPEEVLEKHKIAASIGDVAGSIAGDLIALKGASMFLHAIPYTAKLLQGASRLKGFGAVTRTIKGRAAAGLGAGIETGATFGTHSFAKEAARQVKELDPEAWDLARESLLGGTFGSILGGASGAFKYTPLMYKSLIGGLSMVTAQVAVSELDGQSYTPRDLAMNFILGTAWELTAGLSGRKAAAEKVKTLTELITKSTTPDQALKVIHKELGLKGRKEVPAFNEVVKDLFASTRPGKQQLRKVTFVPGGAMGGVAPKDIYLPVKTQLSPKKAQSLWRLSFKSGVPEKDTRNALEVIFGVKSMKDLTTDEGRRFAQSFKSYVETYDPVPKTPTFKGELKVATGAQHITAPIAYINTVGAWDFLGPSLKGLRAMRREQFWVNGKIDVIEQAFLKSRGTPRGERRAALKSGTAVFAKTTEEAFANRRLYWEMQQSDFKTKHIKKYPEPIQEMLLDVKRAFDAMFTRNNQALVFSGEQPMRYRQDYVTRVYKPFRMEELRQQRKHPITSSTTKARVFNPTAKERQIVHAESALLVQNVFKSLKAMIQYDYKTIYLTEPIRIFNIEMQNLEQKGLIHPETSKYLSKMMKHVILGEPWPSDKVADATLKAVKADVLINKLLGKFNRELGPNPAQQMSRAVSKMFNLKYIAGNMKTVVRNKFQQFFNLGYYKSKHVAKAMSFRDPQWIKDIKDNIEVLQDVTVPLESGGRKATLGFGQFRKSHKDNLSKNVSAALYQMEELMTDPRFRKFGWMSPKRKGNEPRGFFYPDEIAKQRMEANYQAESTQLAYDPPGLPPVLQTATGRVGLKFTSWSMGYTFRNWREMIHRWRFKKPGWAGADGPTLPPSMVWGVARHLAFSSILIAGLAKLGYDYGSIALGQAIPTTILGAQAITSFALSLPGVNPNPASRRKHQRRLTELVAPIPYLQAIKNISSAVKQADPTEYFLYKTRPKKRGGRKGPTGPARPSRPTIRRP